MTPLARAFRATNLHKRIKDSKEPAFARSYRSAQSGSPTTPREVYVLLLPLGPDRVSKHLPRRTRLRRPAGLEENRSVPPSYFVQGTLVLYTCRPQLSNPFLAFFTPAPFHRYFPISRSYLSLISSESRLRSVMMAEESAVGHSQELVERSAGILRATACKIR